MKIEINLDTENLLDEDFEAILLVVVSTIAAGVGQGEIKDKEGYLRGYFTIKENS